MPEGPQIFPNSIDEYAQMQKKCRSDPDWPDLRPPFDRGGGRPSSLSHHERHLLGALNINWNEFKERFKVVNGLIYMRDGANVENDRSDREEYDDDDYE